VIDVVQDPARAHPTLDIDAHVTLALSLRSLPYSQALLLGAGASLGSGVPSAWGVQEELIGRLAAMQGEDAGADPAGWYAGTYSAAPTYSGLLDSLTHTPAERQGVLRSFFEPTEQERGEGLKQPTEVHRAVARLVAADVVRIILTPNFDRLIEIALQDIGIQPTVIASPSDLLGLTPVQTLECLVVHLHGDYLHPLSMLNTADELERYPAELDAFLDHHLPDHGLVISGWSGEWDPALRAAVGRNPYRFFPTYWVDPFPLTAVADDLRALRGAIFVRATAAEFLGRVADAVDALRSVEPRHPRTAAIAVASAKRALAGEHLAIPLHDTVRLELDRLHVEARLPLEVQQTRELYDPVLARLTDALIIPAALVATCAYWGTTDTDRWWLPDLTRFAEPVRRSGLLAWLQLPQLPATVLLWAAGIAATAARRFDLVMELLTTPSTYDYQDHRVSIATALGPEQAFGSVSRQPHRTLEDLIRPLIAGHLTLGPTVYTEAAEMFEYIRHVHRTDSAATEAGLAGIGPSRDGSRRELELRVDNARRGASQTQLAEETQRLEEFRRSDEELLAGLGAAVPSAAPHIRAYRRGHTFRVGPAERLEFDVAGLAARHPILDAGLCNGNSAELRWSMRAIDRTYAKRAQDIAWQTVPPGGGIEPDVVALDALPGTTGL
jgi:hypothetical protein